MKMRDRSKLNGQTLRVALLGGTALLVSAGLTGCVSEMATDGESGALTDSFGTAAQALTTCTPASTKELATDALGLAGRQDYPRVLAGSFKDEVAPGSINDNGQVMIGLSAVVSEASSPSVPSTTSSRGIRWNAGTGAVEHIGVPSSRDQGRVHSGAPTAMNGSGAIVGHGIHCRDFVTGMIWRGDNPLTTSTNNEFSLAYTSGTGADKLKTFCDRSAPASDADVTPDMPDWALTQTVSPSDINDSGVAVGTWNGTYGGTAQESGGVVGIDVLRFNQNVGKGEYAWYPDDSSAAAGLRAVPDKKLLFNTQVDFEAKSPRLDYDVNLTGGTYFVHVKGTGPAGDATNGDSVHVGIRKKGAATVASYVTVNNLAGWTKGTALTVAAAGTYTVSVWMREDGVRLDKLALAKSSTFVATDDNTAGGGIQADGARSLAFKWYGDNRVEYLSCNFTQSTAPAPGKCDSTFSNPRTLRINSKNQVIAVGQGYFWDATNVLTNISDAFQSQAINGQGLVVGNGGMRPMYWTQNGVLNDLNRPGSCGNFCGSAQNNATAVNDVGQIAGVSINQTDGRYHVYVWSAATGMVDRGEIGAVDTSANPLMPQVIDINDSGALIINGATGSNVAYYSAPGSTNLTPIPNMQRALGLNNKSQVVGVGGFGVVVTPFNGYKKLLVWQPELCVINNTLFNATFDAAASGNWDGFSFNATPFGPAALNSQTGVGENGRLKVSLGANFAAVNPGNSAGGFQRTFTLAATAAVSVTFDYTLTMPAAFESNECGQVRAKIVNTQTGAGTYFGTNGNDYLVQLCGAGSKVATHTFATTLAPGAYALVLGGYLNDNTAADEIAAVTIDNVKVTTQ